MLCLHIFAAETWTVAISFECLIFKLEDDIAAVQAR